jgi:hypothetical protein
MSATRSTPEEKIMSFMSGPFIEAESAHRALRVRADYGTRQHHPFRAIGRAIVRGHRQVQGK